MIQLTAENRFLTVFSSYCIVQDRRSRYVVVWEGKSRLQQPLELEINRELQLPWNACFVGCGERRNGRTLRTIELVQSDDICMIEKVKRLHDEIQLSVRADFEELQDTQIKLHLTGGS